MERRILSFRQDDEGRWVADLECGHQLHVHHDPPWQVREWVTRDEARTARLGTLMDCRACAVDT